MHVTVKLFASYRELAGASETTLDLPDGSTVGAALDALSRRYPEVAATLKAAPLAACNLRHVPPDHVLSNGDELAVFPPVSGG
ncbi:MAG: MoaD/ThiS family protein [Candidatus Polarisedimenticolia bacterium]